MTENERPRRTSRRRLLSAIAGTGAATALGTLASNYGTTAVAATDSSEDVLLGSFESSLDGWRADGDVTLTRVTRTERPIAVTEGEYALDATVHGDPTPTISRLVSDLDIAMHPHFVADIAPGRVDGTDAPVAFRFRLYRPTDGLDGLLTQELVAESDPVTVPQAAPGRIYWDASHVETGLLDVVSVLEIVWYPADRDPESVDDPIAYRGGVVLDAVRATASVDPVGNARLAATMRDLQFEHGHYVRTEVTEEFDAGEAGRFVFANGAAVSYRFETLGSDQFLLAIAGTEIELGGGWS